MEPHGIHASLSRSLHVQSRVKDLDLEALDWRMSLGPQTRTPHALVNTIAASRQRQRSTLIAEIARLSPSESPEDLARRCQQYVDWGTALPPHSSTPYPIIPQLH